MHCKNCGEELKPEDRFCEKCGMPIENINPNDISIEQPQQEIYVNEEVGANTVLDEIGTVESGEEIAEILDFNENETLTESVIPEYPGMTDVVNTMNSIESPVIVEPSTDSVATDVEINSIVDTNMVEPTVNSIEAVSEDTEILDLEIDEEPKTPEMRASIFDQEPVFTDEFKVPEEIKVNPVTEATVPMSEMPIQESKEKKSPVMLIVGMIVALVVIAIIVFAILFFTKKKDAYVGTWNCNSGAHTVILNENKKFEWYGQDKTKDKMIGTYKVRNIKNDQLTKDQYSYEITLDTKDRILSGVPNTQSYQTKYGVVIDNKEEASMAMVNVTSYDIYTCVKTK